VSLGRAEPRGEMDPRLLDAESAYGHRQGIINGRLSRIRAEKATRKVRREVAPIAHLLQLRHQENRCDCVVSPGRHCFFTSENIALERYLENFH